MLSVAPPNDCSEQKKCREISSTCKSSDQLYSSPIKGQFFHSSIIFLKEYDFFAAASCCIKPGACFSHNRMADECRPCLWMADECRPCLWMADECRPCLCTILDWLPQCGLTVQEILIARTNILAMQVMTYYNDVNSYSKQVSKNHTTISPVHGKRAVNGRPSSAG